MLVRQIRAGRSARRGVFALGSAALLILLTACVATHDDADSGLVSGNPGSRSAGSDAEALIGRQRPDFNLEAVDGGRHRPAEWDGKVVVVNFWASWCVPCLREIPSFVELQESYGDQGLQFVGIALDTRAAVEGFVADLDSPVNYPLLIADGDRGIEIATAYGNRLGVLPYSVVVDRSGTVSYVQFGEFDHAQAERVIRELL